jgi:hypothetical protein
VRVVFLVLVQYRKICVVSDEFGSDSILFLTILSMKQGMCPICVEIVTLIDGLCCVDFINPIGVVAGALRQRLALSIGPT